MTFQEKILKLEPVNLFEYYDEFPEFRALHKTDQSPKWHAEGDVLTHTNMAIKEALSYAHALAEASGNIQDGISVYLGTLMHDFGKPQATFEKEGRLVAYGHESIGVSVARDFLRKNFPQFGYARREWLLSLVEFHGHPKRMIKDGSSNIKFKKLSLDVNTKQVYCLEQADFRGREAKDIKTSLNYLYKFKDKCIAMNLWDTKYEIPNSRFMSQHVYANLRWRILFNHAKEDDKKTVLNTLRLMGKPPLELMIMMGAPGSGKTTHRETIYPHIETICMDEERKRLCGTENDMSKNAEVYDNCFKAFCDNMKARKNTIWDATSTSRKGRKRIIDVARRLGAQVSIVTFDIPLDVLLKRNAGRVKRVPDDIVKKFYHQIQSPKSYEYDRLLVVDENVKYEEGKDAIQTKTNS